MDNKELDAMVEAMKNGIDNNASDAPAMSIDPKSHQVSVVGDPNKVKEGKGGKYVIRYVYSADAITDEDKAKMKKNEEYDEYYAEVTYEDKRVKPLHRTKVAMIVAEVLTRMSVILEDGSYTSDTINRVAVQSFLMDIEKVSEMAKLVLDIPDDQLQYIDSYSLFDFFIQMLDNEPNVIKEAAGFLEPSLIARIMKVWNREDESKTPSTPQS